MELELKKQQLFNKIHLGLTSLSFFVFVNFAVFDMGLPSIVIGAGCFTIISTILHFLSSQIPSPKIKIRILIIAWIILATFVAYCSNGITGPLPVIFVPIPLFALIFLDIRETIAWTLLIIFTFLLLTLFPISTVQISRWSEFIIDMTAILATLIASSIQHSFITAHREESEKIKIKLIRSNQESQQLTYITAHDLQEPLRMISSYLQLLSKRYKNKLDADADEFIDFAVNGAVRIKQLLNDLLEYSQVSLHTEKKLVETESILENVLATLKPDSKITHGILPVLMADEYQLKSIFKNIIDNAVKYRSPDRPSQINILAEEKKHEWLFSIQDNGIGIPEEHFERIFAVFQRLHSADEYSGTGIGLSISRKIAENHQGSIWVNSKPGQGSTFYFTIHKEET